MDKKRKKEEEAKNAIAAHEQAWVTMRWMNRVVEWAAKGMPSITDKVQDKPNKTIKKIVEEGKAANPTAYMSAF